MRLKTAYNQTFTTGKYYLYRHVRVDKNEPFYIGIGTRQRGHNEKSIYLRAYTKANRSSFWKNIVNKTKYDIEIIYETDSISKIKQKEIEFIGLYRRKEHGGILCNMTDGGDGLTTSKNAILKRKKTMIENGQAEKNAERLRIVHRERISNGIYSRAKPIYVYDIYGALVQKCSSLKKCANLFGLNTSAITKAMNNNRSTKKYIFSYSDNIKVAEYNIISNKPANCSKKVKIFNIDNGEEETFNSLRYAAIKMGMKTLNHITRYIKTGKYKNYKLILV